MRILLLSLRTCHITFPIISALAISLMSLFSVPESKANDEEKLNELPASPLYVEEVCRENKNKKLYLGLRKAFPMPEISDHYVWYEDYVSGLVKSINVLVPDIVIEYEKNLRLSNTAFFIDGLYGRQTKSYTEAIVRHVYYENNKDVINKIEGALLRRRKILKDYETKKYTGHAYCEFIGGDGVKTAHLLLPINYESDTFFSARDCLRESVLRVFCLGMDAEPMEKKETLRKMFIMTDEGLDRLTDFGRELIQSSLRND